MTIQEQLANVASPWSDKLHDEWQPGAAGTNMTTTWSVLHNNPHFKAQCTLTTY